MDLGTAGLSEQPFPTHGRPLAVVSYESQQQALGILRETHEHPTGLCLLQGPSLSGKSILIRSFLESIDEECAVALVDGRSLNTTRLLHAILRQFGYDIDLSSANELLGLVRVFALQQAASGNPPLIVIENTSDLNPSALRTLCELAELRVRNGNALKMVLVNDRSLSAMIQAPAMQSIAKRILHDFHLRPMTREETRDYIHEKMVAAGAEFPALVFPTIVCDELWRAAGGWPGIIDRVALLALARADSLPVSSEVVEHPALPNGTWDDALLEEGSEEPDIPTSPPYLVVSNHGSILQELEVDRERLLIGRSEHNDIAINSRFISRHHALLVRHGNATLLMDLNSTNGTFVNSERVSNHVLRHEDVITVGHHHIKFSDPFATKRSKLEGAEFADTAIMKTLEDVRSLLAQENTALLPTPSEDLPTIQT
ncbi:MAG TPA: FHA domain-containing protein [Woeseiaceae bacterium]|jgi:type II secretory pathway predicted ATPase ExeA|nr:FHA domain-containing protein [Woeseiaceae bacterium]